MYEVKVSSAAKKDIKRLNPSTRQVVKKVHISKIRADPYLAEPLRYELKGLWSYHFSHQAAQYRIIYEIYPEQNLLVLLMIAPRENIYQRLRRRLGLR